MVIVQSTSFLVVYYPMTVDQVYSVTYIEGILHRCCLRRCPRLPRCGFRNCIFLFDCPCWMLSLCFDSLSFLVIFSCSLVVSTESMHPVITFLSPSCSSRIVYSLSFSLSSFLSHSMSWRNLRIFIYIFKCCKFIQFISAEIKLCHLLKSLEVKQAGFKCTVMSHNCF